MGFYGNVSYADSDMFTDNEKITYESFIDNFYKYSYFIESLFDQLELGIIRENNDLVVISSSNDKKIEKNIIEIIKKLWENFVNFIKTKFNELVEFIKKKYLETNVVDGIIKKLGKDIEYKDLMDAKEKGWQGISTEYCLINPINFDECDIIRDLRSKLSDSNIDDEVEELNKCRDLESAQTKSQSIMDKIKDIREDTRKSLSPGIALQKRYVRTWFGNKDNLKIYVYYHKSDSGYYFPSANEFETIKHMAQNGQKHIKRYKSSLNKMLSDCKKDFYPSFNNSVVNDKNSDDYKIDLLYKKAKMALFQVKIKAYSNAISTVVDILKLQHEFSIKTYLYCVKSTKNYLITN